MTRTHLVGLLLGTEEDWSGAFEAMMARLAPIEHAGETHEFATERVTIEPFDLRMRPRHALVIDRLAHWYYVPREWIKKVALMDGVYLMNNPFTFQSMEKHSAYCAMMRLGRRQPGARRARAQRALRRLRPAVDAPAARGRRLRRVRPLALDRRRDDGHALRPRAPAARPLPDRPLVPGRPHRPRGRDHRPHGQRVLPLGVQLLRDADQGGRGAPDRLRQRVPGRLADLAPLLLPVR